MILQMTAQWYKLKINKQKIKIVNVTTSHTATVLSLV